MTLFGFPFNATGPLPCPITQAPAKEALVSVDGVKSWPVASGVTLLQGTTRNRVRVRFTSLTCIRIAHDQPCTFRPSETDLGQSVARRPRRNLANREPSRVVDFLQTNIEYALNAGTADNTYLLEGSTNKVVIDVPSEPFLVRYGPSSQHRDLPYIMPCQ